MLDRACSLVTEGARDRSPVISGAMSVDVTRLSLLSLVFRLNIALPIAWTLSGRSRMLLVVERVEDFLDSEKDSSGTSQDGLRSNDPRESRDDDPDEVVCWLTCRSEIDACLTLLLRALIRAGDGDHQWLARENRQSVRCQKSMVCNVCVKQMCCPGKMARGRLR